MPLKKFLTAAQKIKEQQHRPKPESPKNHSGDHDEGNWLVSYADMMTLLCGFFILLYSMAKLDPPQYEKVREAMAERFGQEYKSPTQDTAKFISQVLQENGVEKDVVVKSDPMGASVIFLSTIFFETLSSDVKPQGKIVLSKLIESIAERQRTENKDYRIVIEGHTDNRPILGGVFPSNWELSSARAARVVRLFLDRGFKPDHLTAIGYADTYPQAPSRTPSGNWDEEALAKNRRVVIRILEPKVDSIPFPESASQAQAENSAH